MEVRLSRASAVIVQRVPAAAVERFMDWQRGISQAAEDFAGYRGTDIYPPVGEGQHDWAVVVHFDDEPALQRWLAAPVREQWLAKIRTELGEGRLTTAPGGLAAWFAGRVAGSDRPVPAGWKMVLVVLLGLYPTVMLLTLFFPGPYLEPLLGRPVAMLIGNALSVSLLQWVVMPFLNAWLGPWLRADWKRQRGLWIGGLVLILLLLAGLTGLFRLVTG